MVTPPSSNSSTPRASWAEGDSEAEEDPLFDLSQYQTEQGGFPPHPTRSQTQPVQTEEEKGPGALGPSLQNPRTPQDPQEEKK